MSDQTVIDSLAEQLTAQDARTLLAQVAGQVLAGEPRRVCYPYHRFQAQVSVPRLFGRHSVDVECLVDARTGVASTSDRFLVERRAVAVADILPLVQATDAAQLAARRCLAHSLTRRLRTLADFRVRPEYRGVVYKTFWLLSCEGREVLVDSANGAWHLLQAA